MTDLTASVSACANVMLEAGVITHEEFERMMTVVARKTYESQNRMQAEFNQLMAEHKSLPWWRRLFHPPV